MVYPDEVIDPEPKQPETFEGECIGGDGAPRLVDWCASVRRSARRIYGEARIRVNFRTYRIDQLAPLAMLLARLKLSADSVRWILGQQPDLLAAIGYKRVPSRLRMRDAAELLARTRKKLSGKARMAIAPHDGPPAEPAPAP